LGTVTLTWTQVLVVAAAAVGLYLVEFVLFLLAARRESRRAREAQEQLAALAAQVGALGQRVETLEGEIDRVRRQPQTSGQYREAVGMAERGEDARAVADGCGISLAEAELIVALHRSRSQE